MNAWSLFSGVGGFDEGFRRAGITVTHQCESDPWRRDVLAHHFPGVPCTTDVRSVGIQLADRRRLPADVHSGRYALVAEEPDDRGPDVICGGFPCQDLSVAGQRRGLAGDRSGLWFEYARIVDAVQPRWVLIENVPGLLSSDGGRDFGVVLGTLADLGYVGAWRILDSQHFGVPQRRRRVFIIACRADRDPVGAEQRADAVFAVGSRCGGDHPQGGEAGEGVAVASALGTGNGGRAGWRIGAEEAAEGQLVVNALTKNNAGDGGWHDNEETLVVAMNLRGRGGGAMPELDDLASVRAASGGSSRSYMAFDTYNQTTSDQVQTLRDPNGTFGDALPAVTSHSGVRRLTPTECELLQGFPPGWTDIPGVKCPDSRRYAAMGDAVTVPVIEWIARRIVEADRGDG